ncbi:MAG: hypothetical protein Q7J78_05440 [Clostridiales bacterium]|nr:hypothetical protein [Clostridiales bacterium]
MTTAVKNSVYRLEIERVTEPDSTRDGENLGTMVCFHSRYSLGDRHSYGDKDAFLFDLLENQTGDTEKAERKYEELAEKVDRSIYKRSGAHNKAVDDEVIDFLMQKHIILPLFLYDHSGIAMNTKGFSCPWDSGQIGWIYVSHDELRKQMGIHEIIPEALKRVEEILETEVHEYDCYLRGECYGYRLYENDVEVDSCYGFVGEFDDVKKQITEYLPEDAKELAEAAEYGEEITDEEELVL